MEEEEWESGEMKKQYVCPLTTPDTYSSQLRLYCFTYLTYDGGPYISPRCTLHLVAAEEPNGTPRDRPYGIGLRASSPCLVRCPGPLRTELGKQGSPSMSKQINLLSQRSLKWRYFRPF